MNGVKGFIIKEFYLRRKSVYVGAAIYIMIFILAASFCLSCDYGNMKNNENIPPNASLYLAYMLAATGIATIDGQCNESITKDIKSKWNYFEYTLPLSPQRLAAIRIGILSGTHLLGTIISTLLSLIIFALAHKSFNAETAANIAAISLIILTMMVAGQFLVLKFKDPQKASAWLLGRATLIGMAVGLYATYDIVKSGAETEEEMLQYLSEKYLTPLAGLRDMLFPFTLLIFAAIVIIGYFLFLDAIKRREK